MHLWWLVVVLILHGIRKANFYSSTPPTSIDFQSLHFAVCKHAKLHQKLGFVLMLSTTITSKIFTRLALGRQSRIEKTSLAFPSGSSGRKTPMASTSIWYKQLENTGSGSSRRYSFNKPARIQKVKSLSKKTKPKLTCNHVDVRNIFRRQVY